MFDTGIAPKRFVFVGGPGRSGTSFVADRLGHHPEVCSFPDVELKLLTEKSGLIDLHHALVQSYSPNRATVAIDQFSRFFDALVDGGFGQQALNHFTSRDEWMGLRQAFLETMRQDGQAGPTDSQTFHNAARQLLVQFAEIATRTKKDTVPPTVFLEKTPHALLAPDFLLNLAPGCNLLHVMRDPRSIAFSLRSMNWGPDTLAGCCRWVANYCSAWLHSQKMIAEQGAQVTCLQIEAVASEPSRFSEQVCATLGVAPIRALFRGADTRTLNGWVKRCSDADLRAIDAALGGWACHFEYTSTKIGEISKPPDIQAA